MCAFIVFINWLKQWTNRIGPNAYVRTFVLTYVSCCFCFCTPVFTHSSPSPSVRSENKKIQNKIIINSNNKRMTDKRLISIREMKWKKKILKMERKPCTNNTQNINKWFVLMRKIFPWFWCAGNVRFRSRCFYYYYSSPFFFLVHFGSGVRLLQFKVNRSHQQQAKSCLNQQNSISIPAITSSFYCIAMSYVQLHCNLAMWIWSPTGQSPKNLEWEKNEERQRESSKKKKLTN